MYITTLEDNKKIWEKVLSDVEMSVSKANFNTWFKDTDIIKYENGTIYLSVPNEFVKNWLSEKYHKFILKSLRGIQENIRNVDYIVVSGAKKKELSMLKQSMSINNELPLNDFYINKDDNLNPKYIFDSFVVGTFNELAHAASQAIIKKQGIVYNPLFVYGNTGYGKTHLIQAIGNHLKTSDDKKVFYVTSEKFSVDCVNSIQQNKLNQFKEKYRKYDVLIMDDIQFISNKERSQEELFHLFNTLYDGNKQIIFSSDKHPSYIPGLADRLKSRFSQGMIVDVQAPDAESRMEILRNKSKMNNFYLAEDIINFIAISVQGNIRDLEGILNSVICQTQLKGRDLNMSEIKNLLKNNVKPKKNVSVKEVVKIIASFYNLEETTIYEKTRRKEVVKPRQVIMYILRKDFNVSYPSIGEKLGGRDHTTVIHSCKKIEDELKDNNLLEQELEQIRSMF
ncbi:TPA: chromosomal replication initiator protein DnaA [Candidatus Campbellbacteria bacterium]|uniref:Chromosomal replication initiator protein DnaA n=2 Tax=Candidatus Campbelliibacteriota TaxID=1752727 RepID=A0A1F5ELN1_9BACT|nr:MAG: chromosomal replication initiation protein, chromosomal replication initiator protein [Candidatus Campbellbacteria bacterium GW2011_OD1_34_28]KKP75284.1 MAG: Chromosomal replication initiator protein DnaA [Candidatus Campbellbacteria bacterium GW2011_GWD2_35_24]KKP76155.1 MAG: chromosomal replication initiation protein, chromosomal replication initiator protein [Candidatus Campbellbacteria bacterium GW2011_GWC2_35_28]KKP77344.1 MAG: Chromosomal replication initiator protein DnaA [Candida